MIWSLNLVNQDLTKVKPGSTQAKLGYNQN
jgi:hypothetical protein